MELTSWNRLNATIGFSYGLTAILRSPGLGMFNFPNKDFRERPVPRFAHKPWPHHRQTLKAKCALFEATARGPLSTSLGDSAHDVCIILTSFHGCGPIASLKLGSVRRPTKKARGGRGPSNIVPLKAESFFTKP